MRQLRILIKKNDSNETIVKFDEPLVIKDETITVKCATVFWDYNNLTLPTHITHGTKKIWFKTGYWTASMITEKLKENNISADLIHYSCKIKLKPAENLALLNLSPLLGFTESQQRITKGKSVVSDLPVNVNLGMKYISVKCNIVDGDSTSFSGKRDKTIAILPITTTQSLKGSITHYININSETQLGNGIYSELKFSTNYTVGDILLELMIK